MSKHRNPRRKVPKRSVPDNLATSLLIRRLYDALVELESLAMTADEAVSMLPAGPTGRHKRTPDAAVHARRPNCRPGQCHARAGREAGRPARGQVVNHRALALAESLRGQLAALGPGVRSVSADESLSWLFVRIGAATDEILRPDRDVRSGDPRGARVDPAIARRRRRDQDNASGRATATVTTTQRRRRDKVVGEPSTALVLASQHLDALVVQIDEAPRSVSVVLEFVGHCRRAAEVAVMRAGNSSRNSRATKR